MLDCYEHKHFIKSDGSLDLEPNTSLLKPILKKYGIKFDNKYQKNEYITIYPKDYFCPLDGSTGEINITINSYAMHLFNGAWLSEEQKKYNLLYKKYYTKIHSIKIKCILDILLKCYLTYKVYGIKNLIGKIFSRILKI